MHPRSAPTSAKKTGFQPDSVEWVYATASVRGGKKAECAAVFEWVEGEKDCRGPGCAHGANLARDWLLYCRKDSVGPAERVQELSGTFGSQAAGPDTPCAERELVLLRDGCGEGLPECLGRAEKWATRCAESLGSPLGVFMVEQMLRQADADGRRVSLDSRSCVTLEEQLVAAASCSQQFECEEADKLVKRLEATCLGGKPPGIRSGTAQLAVQVGAGAYPPPLEVQLGAEGFREEGAKLSFPDRSGAALTVCGKSVEDLAAYLAARKSCSEEFVFVKLFEEDNKQLLRLGRFAHSDDTAFFARFPALRLEGEAEARAALDLKAFELELDRAAGLSKSSAHAAKARSLLIATLARFQRFLETETMFIDALRARDKQFVGMMIELGKAKAKLVSWSTSASQLAIFASRSESLPLADLSAEGELALGAENLAVALDLSELPNARQAYIDTLDSLLKRARKRSASARALEELAIQAGAFARTCGAEQKQVRASGGALLDCGFGVENCSPEFVGELEERQARSRAAAANAWRSLQLTLSGLAPAARAQANGVASSMGCETPGW